MLEALELLPLLLAPVAGLLFLALLRSRRVRYPHDLLEPSARRSPASLLPRSFRGRYDVILDAAAAAVLAFALPSLRAAPAEGRVAAVVDCSRSMLSGERGQRALDLALERLGEDPSLASADAFVLAFDPPSRRSRLRRLDDALGDAAKARRGADPASRADALAEALSFFSVDYGALGDLARRGYGRVALLTDDAGGPIEGVEAVESGFVQGSAAYPASVRLDRASDSWMLALAESGPRGELALYSWDEGTGKLPAVPASRYAIEDSAAGRLLRLAESGVYVASIRPPGGGTTIELAFRLDPRGLGAAASGAFSERIAEAFPFLEPSPRPSVVLRDAGSRGAGRAEIVTATQARDGEFLLDPGLARGALVAAGLAPGCDLALGPSSLANDDLPIAYLSLISRRLPPPFATAPPPDTTSLARVGGAFIASTGRGPIPVIPPPEEFFEPRGGAAAALPPARAARWPWALALAAIALAKIGAHALLRARRDPEGSRSPV